MRVGQVWALAFVPSVAAAQGARVELSDTNAGIVATVTRTARLAPDRATIYFFVEGTSENPREAAQRAAQKVEAVTSALRQAGITADLTSTVPYGAVLAPSTGYPAAPAQPSYVARYIVRISCHRIDYIMPAVTAALGAGASSSSAPQFQSQSLDATRQRLQADAVVAARQEAEGLAAALGGRLGALVDVSSTAGSGQASSYVSWSGRYDVSGPSQPPEVLATATVTVRFRLVGTGTGRPN